jgi:diamine N-acetyltransferase
MLENEKIKLRAIEPEDLEFFYVWENDTSVWNISNTITPFSRYILKKYIESSHLDIFENKQLRLMIDAKPIHTSAVVKTVGCIDLFDFDPFHLRAGIGILIGAEPDRQKGYAYESLKLLIEYSFKQLKLHQLYCNIGMDNQPSIELFKKSGFEITGHKKEWNYSENGWTDEYFLQLINNCFSN